MLRIDRQKKAFTRLETPKLAEASITERNDLQEYICNSPEAFCEEIGQRLFLIDKEVQPSDDVDDRIDLLALDKEGQAVIIELKRGNNKLQMFQAISYAAMVARWKPEDFLARLEADKLDKLTDFLVVEKEEINLRQRIVLVAEAFDYSVLIGAERVPMSQVEQFVIEQTDFLPQHARSVLKDMEDGGRISVEPVVGYKRRKGTFKSDKVNIAFTA